MADTKMLSLDPVNGRSDWKQAVVMLSGTVIAVAVVATLYYGRAVLIPIAVATLLAFILNPIVHRLRGWGLSRSVAAMGTVAIVGSCLTLMGIVGSHQVSNLVAEIPDHSSKIKEKVKSIRRWFEGGKSNRFGAMIEEINQEVMTSTTPEEPLDQKGRTRAAATEATSPQQNTASAHFTGWEGATEYLGTAFEGLATLAFSLILVIFFLLESHGLRDRIVLLAGRSRLTLTSKVLDDASTRVSKYIMMVALVNGGFGLALGLGLWFLGAPYALLWGVVAAVLRFLPYIGPWAGALFPIAQSFAMSTGWWQPVSVFAFVLILELITNNVVEPLLFSHSTGVSPTALLISAAIWMYLWGPVGLVLSAPIAVCLVVLGKNIPQLAFLNTLLGDQPALSAQAGFYQRLLSKNRPEATELVVKRLREPDAEMVFDELLIPALRYAKRDLARGHLQETDGSELIEVLNDSFTSVNFFADTVSPDQEGSKDSLKTAPQKIVGCAANGAMDRTALAMLKELLDPTRWELVVAPDGMLTSELPGFIAEQQPVAVCLASLPPRNLQGSRYLCQKIRSALALPIVVGHFGQRQLAPSDQGRLTDAGATAVLTSLLQVRDWLESRYSVFSQPRYKEVVNELENTLNAETCPTVSA